MSGSLCVPMPGILLLRNALSIPTGFSSVGCTLVCLDTGPSPKTTWVKMWVERRSWFFKRKPSIKTNWHLGPDDMEGSKKAFQPSSFLYSTGEAGWKKQRLSDWEVGVCWYWCDDFKSICLRLKQSCFNPPMVTGHLDYKYWEFLKIVWEFWSA